MEANPDFSCRVWRFTRDENVLCGESNEDLHLCCYFLAILGVVQGLGFFRHGLEKSRHCSDDSCNSSPVFFRSPSPSTHAPPTAASAYNLPNSPTIPNPPEFNRNTPPPDAFQTPPETSPSPSPPIPSLPTAATGEAPSLSPPGSVLPVTPSPMHAQLRFRVRESFSNSA